MRNTLLIATLSLFAFAWAQAADRDSYNQTVAAQAQQNNLAEVAIAQSAAVAAASEAWNNEQPGSIASNSGEDFYGSTVGAQAQLNSLIKAAFTQSAEQQEAMPSGQETSSLADPESMASNENAQSADEDSYSQKVDEQADLNSRILGASRLEVSVQLEGSSGSDQPGSMASDEGAQSPSDDFYGQTVAIQANVNQLLQDSNQQQ
jgi:hypothetical protein